MDCFRIFVCKHHKAAEGHPARKLSGEQAALAGNGRFQRAEKTIWNDEDLDIPTYLRRSLSLDR